MAVKIRLKRLGQKKSPFYRIVVADERSPRDGRNIAERSKANHVNAFKRTNNSRYVKIYRGDRLFCPLPIRRIIK